MSDPLTIRPVDTDEDAKRVFLFLCDFMLPEVARATIDPNKAFIELYRVCNEEAAWIVENEDGEIVASAGLIKVSGGHWYGVSEWFLTERWLFVKKDYRKDGRALELMLTEISDLAAYLGIPAYVLIFDPEKAEKQQLRGRRYPQVAVKLSIVPAGRMIVVQPPRKVA